MLSASQAALARHAVITRLTARCDIYAVTDDEGVQDWDTPTETDVPCLVGMPRQGGAMAMWDRTGNEPGAMVWLPIEVAIKSGDRIVVGSTTYQVVHTPSVRTDELLHGVMAIETRPPGAAV